MLKVGVDLLEVMSFVVKVSVDPSLKVFSLLFTVLPLPGGVLSHLILFPHSNVYTVKGFNNKLIPLLI